MKRVIFADLCANRDHYVLALPNSMNRWKVDSLYDFLNHPQSEVEDEGYIPLPIDPLHFEQFRQLLNVPEITMNAGSILIQNGSPLKKEDEIILKEKDTIIEVTREECDFKDIVSKVSILEQNITALNSCIFEICEALDQVLDLESYPVRNRNYRKLTSFSEIIENSKGNISDEEKLCIIWRLARILYLSPFENITRLLNNRQSRPGYSVWKNVSTGFGGICAEKTSALGFICDILNIRYSHVLGSVNGLPDDYENQLIEYAESGGELATPDWAQHHLMEINIGNENYLIDSTNGNFPFMFLDSNDSKKYFKAGIRTRMVYNTEKIKLRRTTKITGDILLTLSEFHIPELHFQYIFKQGLGIQITSKFFVGVYFDWGGERSMAQQNYYSSMAKKVGFPYPRFLHKNNLDSLPNEGLRKILDEIIHALRLRYSHSEYTGDFTFVLQPITNNFWESPRVSKSVVNKLGKTTALIGLKELIQH